MGKVRNVIGSNGTTEPTIPALVIYAAFIAICALVFVYGLYIGDKIGRQQMLYELSDVVHDNKELICNY